MNASSEKQGKRTYNGLVRLVLAGMQHAAAHVGIDGEDEGLDENTAIERDRVEVDCLAFIVVERLSGDGEPCDGGGENGRVSCVWRYRYSDERAYLKRCTL